MPSATRRQKLARETLSHPAAQVSDINSAGSFAAIEVVRAMGASRADIGELLPEPEGVAESWGAFVGLRGCLMGRLCDCVRWRMPGTAQMPMAKVSFF